MKKRRRILRSISLDEVSAVDRPAAVPAGAVLRKNHEANMNNEPMNNNQNKNLSASLDAILAEAESVLSKGASPTVTRDQAELAMLSLAEHEALDGEGVCDSYARLCESDARMQKLYALGQAADAAEVERAEQLSKRGTRNERVWELMVKGANHNRLAGETVEAALDRLMKTDKTYADAYALYCE